MSMDHTPRQPHAVAEDGEQWHYELVPLLALPQVDLSVSIRSRLVRNTSLHRAMRKVGSSSITFLCFMLYQGICFAVIFVPASIGQTLAVTGALLGLPAVILAIGNLRFDMVRVLLATYDIWYFSTVSTIVSVLLSIVFHDARCLFMVMSWLSFITNVFIDARIADLRRLWIVNVVSTVGYVLLAGVVSVGMIDGARAFDVIHSNGHTLPAASLIRDSVTSMVVVILRNVVRERRRVFRSKKFVADTAASTIQCVSFRCRLRFQPVATPSANSPALRPHSPSASLGPMPPHATILVKTQLQFAPAFDSIDARNTLLPIGPLWRISPLDTGHTRWKQQIFKIFAILGFLINNIALVTGVVAPHLASEKAFAFLVLFGGIFSVIFVAVCLAATQRRLLWGVITSFEFLFIAIQATTVHFTLLDLCRWQPVMVAVLAIELFWSSWFMCWDAILPPVRLRLGLTTRLTAWIGTGLIAVMAACNVVTFTVLPPYKINDRVVWSGRVLDHDLELRPLSWYVSCSASILTWSLRIIWRLWQAADDELVVLDGPVIYENAPRKLARRVEQNAIAPFGNAE